MKPVMQSAVAITLFAASTTLVAAEPVDSASAVTDALNAAGYAEVRDIEQDDGLWEAEVRGADGDFHDLHIVPATGEILDANSDRRILTAEEIESLLTAEGYTKISDLDLEDAVWDAEAVDAGGSRVDLVINGFDGKVLSSDQDD
jgi:uncharacterized membrane protein YkoI